MKFQTQIQTWRRRAYLTVATALPLLMVAPVARAHAEATAGLPGTDFYNCQNTAWSDYNKCLEGSAFAWERKVCDLVFEANIVWCGSVYYHRTQTGT